MTEGIWTALIGVGGTIIGTIIGWLLGKIDFGRLYLTTEKLKIKFFSINTNKKDNMQKVDFTISFVISLYNNTNTAKVFRDATLVIANDYKILTTQPLNDFLSARYSDELKFVGETGVVNIPAKFELDIKIYKEVFFEQYRYSPMRKIYLQYKDGKFKTKKVLLKNLDSREYNQLLLEYEQKQKKKR